MTATATAPGPKPSLLEAFSYRPGREPLAFFTNLARTYGDVVAYRLGGERLIFVNDPQHIKDESARNKAVRDFTIKALADLGYPSTESQTNFIFTDIGKTMTAAAFRDACAAKGVMVGRDFPPLEKQWARISLGTMEEMQKATDVFRSVLKPASTTSAGKGR